MKYGTAQSTQTVRTPAQSFGEVFELLMWTYSARMLEQDTKLVQLVAQHVAKQMEEGDGKAEENDD